MPVAYDENVILDFADDLYRRAASLVVGHTVLGVVLGGLIGAAGSVATTNLSGVGVALVAVLGGVLGFAAGRSRAFSLKLAAQTALCQVRIERNTRARGTDLAPPFAVGNAGAFPAQRYDR